ncbi:MAG: hypothetical protein OEY94_01410 [Alphaproteobacteria bacterium]|nr:hypothetical protein [Alphaproteobacteria bacterium]
MSLSILLWLFISTFLLGFWLWTSYVLYKQKRAWKIYAEKRKLRYDGNGLYESPSFSGSLSEHKILAFTSDHSEYDARSQRRLTSIEVTLNSALPLGTAIASGGMVPYIETVKLAQEFKPDAKGWDDSYIIRTADKSIVSVYLNEKRLKTLLDLMKTPRVWIVLIFYDGGGLLRLDTPAPLSDPKELDKMVKMLLAAAEDFELGKGEYTILRKKSKELKSSTATLDVDDDLSAPSYELELEDEGIKETVKGVEGRKSAKKGKSQVKSDSANKG